MDTETGVVSGHVEEVPGGNFKRPKVIRLYAYLSSSFPDQCLLVAADQQLQIQQSSFQGRCVPVGITNPMGQHVSLYDLGTGSWACVAPSMDDLGFDVTFFGRQVVDIYETLKLLPLEHDAVPETVCRYIEQIESQYLSYRNDPDVLLTIDREQFEVVAYMLGRKGVEELCDRVVQEDFSSELGAYIFNRKIDAAAAAQLKTCLYPVANKTGENSVPVSHLSIDLDELADLSSPERQFSASSACISALRRRVEPRRDVCLIASARNEGLYLLEWIAYHQSIGISDIIIYTNNNDDGSDELLRLLANHGVIRLINNNVRVGINAQRKAYGHALYYDCASLDYNWCLFIDLDEYMMFDRRYFSNLRSFLSWHETERCDAIALNWLVYGSAGEGRWRDDFVLRRFDHALGIDPHIKTMFRPRFFNHSTPHYPTSWRDENRVTRKNDRELYSPYIHTPLGRSGALNPNSNVAWIGHFFYRSAQEYLAKFAKNRGDEPTSAGLSNSALTPSFVSLFARQFSETKKRDVQSNDVWLDGLQSYYARLVALPGIEGAHLKIRTMFERKLELIVPLFQDAPGIREAGDDGKVLMSVLDRR